MSVLRFDLHEFEDMSETLTFGPWILVIKAFDYVNTVLHMTALTSNHTDPIRVSG